MYSTEFDGPRWLVVLCEEELVIVDLTAEDWPEVRAPLLACIHSAPITCTVTVGQIAAGMMDQIVEAGKSQQPANAWPLTGGKDMRETLENSNQLLLTGLVDLFARHFLLYLHSFRRGEFSMYNSD